MTKEQLTVLKEIYEKESGLIDLKEKYDEYKKLDTPRNRKRMKAESVLDDYDNFMDECELIFVPEGFTAEAYTVKGFELPKPSSALEAFKNKFNKLF